MAETADDTGRPVIPPAGMRPVPARAEWLLSDDPLSPAYRGTPATGAPDTPPPDTPPPDTPPQPVRAAAPATKSIRPSLGTTGAADGKHPDPRQPLPRAGVLPQRRLVARPLRIAMMGSRGIPASYSGFETCVEQLAVRLVERGHEVTVYCRSHHIKWPERTYKGVRLVKLPTITSKHLDTIVHTLLSLLHGTLRRYDAIYICGVGNAPLAGLPRLVGKPTVVNVDGADWQRDKWGGFARRYLRFAERAATRMPSCIVADSRVVERYYLEHFGQPSIFIPYGSDVPHLPPGAALRHYGLRADGYLLWVGRLVPENNAHDVIAAYQRLGGPATGLQLCVLGDAPYSTDYIMQLKAQAGPGVVFTGYVFGDGYHELGSNARAFVFASGVGGTHPALLEAMAFGNCVVVNDMAANLETVGDAAIPYAGGQVDDLVRVLGETIANPARIVEYRRRAAARAAVVYSWDAVTDQYEALFARLAGVAAG